MKFHVLKVQRHHRKITPQLLRQPLPASRSDAMEIGVLHPLLDGSGIVARAFLPEAARVEVQPVVEKDMPTITLNRIPKTDVFEGTTSATTRVYAYDLVVTDQSGNISRARDPYSFLPTIS